MECLVLLHFISKKEVFGIQVFRSVDTDTTTPPEEVVFAGFVFVFANEVVFGTREASHGAFVGDSVWGPLSLLFKAG